MRRPKVYILAVLLLSAAVICVMAARVGIPAAESELGDLTAVATLLGVVPNANGKLTAAGVLEALSERLAAVESSSVARGDLATLACRTAALEQSLAMEYGARICAIEQQLSDLVSQLQHLGGSANLQQFVAQLQRDIQELQCALLPCAP